MLPNKYPFLALTDNGLWVVTGDIMELDSIIVEVVENCQTALITLSVVRLGSAGSKQSRIENSGL